MVGTLYTIKHGIDNNKPNTGDIISINERVLLFLKSILNKLTVKKYINISISNCSTYWNSLIYCL